MVQTQVPVQLGSIYEISVTGLSHEGDGVGRYQGFTIFVPGALIGERVKARIIEVQKRFARARIEEILEASAERVNPSCDIYGQCGGCQLQHLSYNGQLAFKEQQVKDALQRIGHLNLDQVKIHPILGMQEPWRYRNKAQVPVASKPISQEIEIQGNLSTKSEGGLLMPSHIKSDEGGLIAGFYAANTHDVIDISSCQIQHSANEEIVLTVRNILRELNITAYNRLQHTGIVRHIIAKVAYATGKTMVVLVTTTKDFPKKKEFIANVRKQLPHVVSIMLNVNQDRGSKVMGEQTLCLWGEEELYDTIGTIRFAISANSFYQVNPLQTQVLYKKALEYAELNGNETVIDAYCGVGTISLFLAQSAKHVYGIEIVGQAIADAKRNAELNNISNATFIVGKAEVEIPKLHREGIKADVIVVDPPRKGCDEDLLATIVKMQPKRMVYVSCNPSTLARDLKYLEEHGFRTEEVQPVDMFPHTAHVECVVATYYVGVDA